MSDRLEDFIRQNREAFDQKAPSDTVWNGIESGLNQAAAGTTAGTAGGASATAAKTGLLKLSLGMKLAATALIATVAGVGLYFGVLKNDGKPDGPGIAEGNQKENREEVAPTETPEEAQVEFINYNDFVQPPIPEADVPYQGHDVVAETGGEIRLGNGTIISIPENAFVDQDGKPVTGKVKISYREFHNSVDILASGIPMTYEDETGTMQDFQTAGMMEIQGSQGESPVFIAEGKSIQVEIASFTDETDHRLYFLDPEGKQWEDIGVAEIKTNATKAKALKLLPAVPPQPVKPKKFDKNDENTFDFAVDYQDFPELKPFKQIVWEFTEKRKIRKNEWAFGEVWEEVKLEVKNKKKGLYTLVLSNDSRTFSTTVRPVLDGEDYKKALKDFESKMGTYDDLLVQREKEESRLSAQADLLRSFSINRFGIYNCDRFARMPYVLNFKPEWEFDEGVYMDLNKTLVYHICGDNRSLLTYVAGSMKDFKYYPEETNILVTVLPDNKIGIFTQEDFAKLDRRTVRDSKRATIKMRTAPKEVKSLDQLRSLIGV